MYTNNNISMSICYIKYGDNTYEYIYKHIYVYAYFMKYIYWCVDIIFWYVS